MQAPLPATTVATTPGGTTESPRTMTTTMSRAVTFGTNGALVSQVDTTTVNTKATTSTYNVAASTITNVSPVSRQTVSTLDTQGRVVQVQAGNLAPTAYAYDARGRLSAVIVGTGTSARVTSFAYDSLDRLQTVTDPLLRTQSYAYDDANRVTTQTFTDASFVVFGYDADGNITSVTPPGRSAHAFGFTPNDLMSSYTPPVLGAEVPTTYEYNHDKQPTFIHRPDGSQIAFTYDSAGRLSTTTYPSVNGNVTVTRSYSPTTGQLTGVTTSDGQSLAYGYDGNLPTSTTWSGNVVGSVSRTYNNDFRMNSESVNGANSVAYGYDNDGLLTSVDGLTINRDPVNGQISDTTLGSVTDHRTYDGFGQLFTYEAKFGTTSLYSAAYVRDALGRIEQKTETIQGTTTVWNYNYDSGGRLWQVMQNGVLTATYLYDANGNRWSVATASGTQTASYDAQDRLLTYGKWSYTYTANGDLLTKTDTSNGQVTTYTYDAQGNLRHVGLPDGRSIDYVIDSENRRVAKKINGAVVRKWIFENELKPVAEFDGSGTLLARYLDGVTVKGSTSYRVVADDLGTPRLLVSSTTGAVAQRLDLDEWGQVTSDSSAGFQVFGFAGGIYDSDTGLVRFGVRDYDPVVGRWTAKDPIRFEGGQANLFAYVRSDPINGRDPMGLQGAGTDSCSYYAARCIENTGDYYCVEAPKWCQGFGNSTWANCVRACLISWDSALHPSAKPYTPAYDSEHGLCPWSRTEPPDNSWPWTSTNNFAAHAACYASCSYSPPYAPPSL
jgi:RHS repeat-associated protein